MFDKMPLNRTAIIGEHFELECDITSSPHPKIIWKMGDKIVQIIELGPVALVVNSKLESVYDSHIEIYTIVLLFQVVEMNMIKTKLFIPCADKTRIGEYTCMAFNKCNHGIQSKAYVDIAGTVSVSSYKQTCRTICRLPDNKHKLSDKPAHGTSHHCMDRCTTRICARDCASNLSRCR
jgi:hypothetical protein